MNTTPPNSTLLSRLRAAVNKVVVLLRHLPTATWPVISIFHYRRPLILIDRHSSGLIDAIEDELYYDARSASSSSASTTPTKRVLHRTSSCPKSPVAGEEDEDIDRKAEEFIGNFYRQLRIEKQVSLELRYCRGYNHSYSFGSSSQISPYSIPSITSPTS